MKLKTRVLIILMAVFIPGLVLVYVAISQFINVSQNQLDEAHVRQDVQRALGAIEGEVVRMSTICHDWSSWDDTYAFATNGGPAYLSENMMPETFRNLQLDHMTIADPHGRVLWAGHYNSIRHEVQPCSDTWEELLRRNPVLTAPYEDGGDDCRVGLLIIDQHPHLVVARAILTSVDQGLPAGTLIMSRRMGSFEAKDLQKQTGLPVELGLFADLEAAGDAPFVRPTKLEPEHPGVGMRADIGLQRLDEGWLRGYAHLADVSGRPAVTVELERPRDLHLQGLEILRKVAIYVTMLGGLFLVITLGLIERGVLRRMERLGREIGGIGGGTDDAARVSVDGRDEISELQEQINDMLKRLEMARQRLRLSEAKTRELSQHLESAREEESARIARRVHDELGQVLTAAKMEMARLEKLPPGSEAARESWQELHRQIEESFNQVRNLSIELRPIILDDLGLAEAIAWQAREFQRRSGIPCNLVVEPENLEIRGTAATALFRIFQESLMNAARHSGATHVEIVLDQTRDELLLEIRDDGHGITEEQVSNPRSFGLAIMRQRVLALGGRLEIEGRTGQGTRVAVILPAGSIVS